MTYKPLALAAAALVAGYLSFGGAQAANVMTGGAALPGVEKAQDANIQEASHRRRWRRSGIRLGLGFAPFYRPYYYQPYYEPYYGSSYYYRPVGSRHVRYCLNRYRSYHIPSNTFLGFDGDRHRCRSPYRY